MYVTRPLSMYQKDPSALTFLPPECPNSGILVIQDEESQPRCCFGLCVSDDIRHLPFPQNTKLVVRYSTGVGENTHVSRDPVVFIPLLDQPLSSNRYYAIKSSGQHKGEAFSNAREENRVTCLCFSFSPEIKPQPSDPHDIYQQFEIHPRQSGSFFAKSVAPDGVPPHFLRRKGWTVDYSYSRSLNLTNDAPGLDSNLRSKLPDFDLPSTQESSTRVVVGKWYIPFIFVKEGKLEDQMKRSMYYRMELEQRWERIFSCENDYNEDNTVVVDASVEREVVRACGVEVARDARDAADGSAWFRVSGDERVGLSSVIMERMKWEEDRFGWSCVGEREVRVKKIERFGGVGKWKRYGLYVLVESFVLRRMDGSLVLTYDFNHADKARGKFD